MQSNLRSKRTNNSGTETVSNADAVLTPNFSHLQSGKKADQLNWLTVIPVPPIFSWKELSEINYVVRDTVGTLKVAEIDGAKKCPARS